MGKANRRRGWSFWRLQPKLCSRRTSMWSLFSEMQSLKQAYEERVKAHITAAASAGAECSSSQAELTKEKEEHLAVMRLDYLFVLGVSCSPIRIPENRARYGVPTNTWCFNTTVGFGEHHGLYAKLTVTLKSDNADGLHLKKHCHEKKANPSARVIPWRRHNTPNCSQLVQRATCLAVESSEAGKGH